MGKYYCDYCDIYLTHDSMNARKAHNTGRNHISNVRDYFASLGHDTAQSIIDQIIQSHENGGRAAMMAAPSMRLGAGFMNPLGPGMPAFNQPPPFNPPTNVPQYRPPFPPSGPPGPNGFGGPSGPGAPGMGANGSPMAMPPRPGMGMPPGAGGPGGPAPFMPPFAPNAPPAALPPFAPSLNTNGPPTGMPPIGFRPPPAGTGGGPARPGIGAGGGGGGIHPDRMRMMGA